MYILNDCASIKTMLTNEQLKFLADVSVAAGQVFLASLVIPYFVSNIGSRFFLFGIIFAMGSWTIGLFIIRGIKKMQ